MSPITDPPPASPRAPEPPPPLPSAPLMIGPVRVWPPVILAPMEGVTDVTFRRLVRQIGGVGLTCTEFLPAEGLRQGGGQQRGRIAEMATFDDDERPISVQIYGKRPEGMAEAARVVEAMGATICDINMGCPSKKVCSHSGGSALMADIELATQIVRAVRGAIRIPVTVKMRSGFDHAHRNAPELAYRCQEEGAQAVTVHWRTRADLYRGERAVDKIAETVARLHIPVVGNGDVIDVSSAGAMFADTGCAAVMIGRGAMRDPWAPRKITAAMLGEPPFEVTAAEKERVLLGYLDALVSRFARETGALGRFKKISSYFVQGVPYGDQALRQPLLRSASIPEAEGHVRGYFARLRAFEAGDAMAFAELLTEPEAPAA